jgi:hypothetical protein
VVPRIPTMPHIPCPLLDSACRIGTGGPPLANHMLFRRYICVGHVMVALTVNGGDAAPLVMLLGR